MLSHGAGEQVAKIVSGSVARYLPFGEHLGNAPATNPDLTDRSYTGHRQNDDIGLIYMNARYYLPYMNRFISADTIVPDPTNPQQFNRYTYVLNNPLRFTDPTGRCAVGDSACWALADELYSQYGWYMVGLGSNGIWTLEELQILWNAATAIERWFAEYGGGDARGRMRAALGGTQFSKAGIVGNLVLQNNHHVRGSKIHLLPGFDLDIVVHEVGHVIDNRLGTNFMSALLGGGKSDEFALYLGFDPFACLWNRSRCAQNRYGNATLKEEHPTRYARSGPSEDFGETFMLSVLYPERLGPMRTDFMSNMARSLTTSIGEFHGSPYSDLSRYGRGFIVPAGGGGGSFPLALLQ
jgi:RHS repeat-associated protein